MELLQLVELLVLEVLVEHRHLVLIVLQLVELVVEVQMELQWMVSLFSVV